MSSVPNASDAYKTLLFGVKKKRKLESNDVSKEASVKDTTKKETICAARDTESLLSAEYSQDNEMEDEGPEIIRHSSIGFKMRRTNESNKVKETSNEEKILQLRKQNHIFVWGGDIPPPFENFSNISKIPAGMLKNLKEFEINTPTAIQMQVIPTMLEKRQLLASAPTGSGKTLAFALPIILEVLRLKRLPKYQRNTHLMAIILEPTRELAKQVYVQFLKFSQDLSVSCSLMEGNSLGEKVEILVSTPYRLEVALKNIKNSSKMLKALRFLIVDESDRLFDTTEGEERSFRSQFVEIYETVKKSSKRIHYGFFSATYSYGLEQWCKENLENLAVVCIGSRNSATESVHQELIFAGSEQGKILGLQSLFRQGFQPPAIIFVQSKDRARQLFNEISEFSTKLPVALVSSDVNAKQREDSIASFREGRIWILICTELMSRGVDFRGVNLVINFDLPTSIVSYIHRVGRAGRAGRPGRAITYFTNNDVNLILPIATVIKQAGFPVPEYTLRVKKLSREKKKSLLKAPPKRKPIGIIKKRGIIKKKSKRIIKEVS
uniref:ATP-dependent RNA helicase n=1 Tax=Syphacia muris TaxID=451379 RepID=A0A0N5ANU8_9BILA